MSPRAEGAGTRLWPISGDALPKHNGSILVSAGMTFVSYAARRMNSGKRHSGDRTYGPPAALVKIRYANTALPALAADHVILHVKKFRHRR